MTIKAEFRRPSAERFQLLWMVGIVCKLCNKDLRGGHYVVLRIEIVRIPVFETCIADVPGAKAKLMGSVPTSDVNAIYSPGALQYCEFSSCFVQDA